MIYSLIIRNNLTKKIDVINKESTTDSIYLTFPDCDFSDFPDGEYTVYVIENEKEYPIFTNQNDVQKSETYTTKYILVNGDEIVTDKGAIMYIDGEEYQTTIDIQQVELMRIGEFKPTNNNKQYDKVRTYKQYGKQ